MKFLIVVKSFHPFSATHVGQKVHRLRFINYQNCYWYVFCQSTNYFITMLNMEFNLWNVLPCCQSHAVIKQLSLCSLFGNSITACLDINVHINCRHPDKGRAGLWRLAAEHRLHPEHERSVPPSRQDGGRGGSAGAGGQEAAQSGLYLPKL